METEEAYIEHCDILRALLFDSMGRVVVVVAVAFVIAAEVGEWEAFENASVVLE